eukprot:contig_20427_g5030
MDAVDIPPPEVAGIYCGSMVVFLALLSSFRQRALFSYVYILAPSIRLVILCGIAGWAAVVWAMASGRASTAAEQVLVLTAFTLGAVTDVSKELQLCNLEWNYDLFAAVAWANLIATHRAARAEEVRLAAASSADLNAEVRTLRELYFKFALSALNIHATRSGDEAVPKVQCTLDDVINGNVVALKELYEGLGEVVHQRWVEVEEHLITTGTIDRTVGNGAPPFSPDGLNLEEGGRASTAGSSHAEHAPLSDPSALFNGASPPDGWASVPAVASSGGAPTDWTQRPPDG